MTAAAVQKHIVFLAPAYVHVAAGVVPQLQLGEGTARDGHQALLAALAHDAQVALVGVDVGQFQMGELRHPEPAAEHHFYDGAVAVAFPLAQVYGRLHAVYLFRAQHVGQMAARLRRLQQLGGVVGDVALRLQVAEEGAHAAQNAALAHGTDAQVVQAGGKVLQVGQADLFHGDTLFRKIRQQLLHVAQVGVDRVGTEIALQFQVTLVGTHDI